MHLQIWILLKVMCILHLLLIEEGLIREDAIQFMSGVIQKEIPMNLKESLERGDYLVCYIFTI